MNKLRRFWERSLLNKVIVLLTGLVVICGCCPAALLGGGQQERSAAQTPAPATPQVEAPAGTQAAIAKPITEPTTTVGPTETAGPTNTPAPTDTPAPPTDTPEPMPTSPIDNPEIKAYLDKVKPELDIMGQSLGEMGKLMSDPQLADTEWMTKLAFTLAFIKNGHENLLKIEPPPLFEDFHEKLTDGTSHCANATDLIAAALDEGDAQKLNLAAEEIQICSSTMSSLAPELQKLANP